MLELVFFNNENKASKILLKFNIKKISYPRRTVIKWT